MPPATPRELELIALAIPLAARSVSRNSPMIPALAPRLASIEVPVAIVVGRNDPYGLARDAARLRERLPHARLDVLEAGHCVWEERAPEFESIVTQWVSGGFNGRPGQ